QETGALVTIGIKPTWACPGFGYIEQGDAVRLRDDGKIAVHRVVRFREKPNTDLAESFLRKGNFRWNAGMFVWSVPTVLSEFNRHTSELAHFISRSAHLKMWTRFCASNFQNFRGFRSTTRSWKKPSACLSWKRVSIGTTSAAGKRLRV